jgi:hypothetical protein
MSNISLLFALFANVLSLLAMNQASAENSIDWSTAVVDRCTTIIVSKSAGKEGPMVSDRLMSYIYQLAIVKP